MNSSSRLPWTAVILSIGLSTSASVLSETTPLLQEIEGRLGQFQASSGASDFAYRVQRDPTEQGRISIVSSDVFNDTAETQSNLAQSLLDYFCSLVSIDSIERVELIGHSRIDTDLLGMGLVRSGNVVTYIADYLKDNQCLRDAVPLARRAMGSRESITNLPQITSDRLMVSDRVELVLSVDMERYDEARQTGGLILSPGMPDLTELAEVRMNSDAPPTPREQSATAEMPAQLPRGGAPVSDTSYSIVRPLPDDIPGLQRDLGLTHLFQTAGFSQHRYAMRISRVPLDGYASFIDRVKASGLNPNQLMYSLSEDGDFVFVYYGFFNFQREVAPAAASLPAWLQRAQPFADQLDRK